jgi:hypothetical protein
VTYLILREDDKFAIGLVVLKIKTSNKQNEEDKIKKLIFDI